MRRMIFVVVVVGMLLAVNACVTLIQSLNAPHTCRQQCLGGGSAEPAASRAHLAAVDTEVRLVLMLLLAHHPHALTFSHISPVKLPERR